CRCSFGLG
ncbi:cytochrome C and Quinol oxidase polypeptide I family protein, partial [Vibrio parahaemolyticus V-223/04]